MEEPWPGDEKRRRARSGYVPRWQELGEATKEPLSDDQRAELGLPKTFRVIADPGAAQQLVFDPATSSSTVPSGLASPGSAGRRKRTRGGRPAAPPSSAC
jgi:hypothetical protein